MRRFSVHYQTSRSLSPVDVAVINKVEFLFEVGRMRICDRLKIERASYQEPKELSCRVTIGESSLDVTLAWKGTVSYHLRFIWGGMYGCEKELDKDGVPLKAVYRRKFKKETTLPDKQWKYDFARSILAFVQK